MSVNEEGKINAYLVRIEGIQDHSEEALFSSLDRGTYCVLSSKDIEEVAGEPVPIRSYGYHQFEGACNVLNIQNIGKVGGVMEVLSVSKVKAINNSLFTIISEIVCGDRVIGYRIYSRNGKVGAYKLHDVFETIENIRKKAVEKRIKSPMIFSNAVVVKNEAGTKFLRAIPHTQFVVEDVQPKSQSVTKPSDTEATRAKEPAVIKVKHHGDKRAMCKEYEAAGYSKEQIKEIMLGIKSGVNIKMYENVQFTPPQMKSLRRCMEEGNSPERWANPKFKADAMDFYRMEAKYGSGLLEDWMIDSKYSTPQLLEIRLGYINGVDVSVYKSPRNSAIEMRDIRQRLEAKIWSAESMESSVGYGEWKH